MKFMIGLVLAAALAGPAAAAPASDARLQAVEDRQAIEQLVGGDYVRALDGRNWEAYAANFTVDGKLAVFGTTMNGRADILKYFTTPGKVPPPSDAQHRILHIISNLSYRIEGDHASGGAYWQDVGVAANGVPGVLSAGHYEDELRREGGRWKFSQRTIVTDVQTVAPAK
jgi:hypothetical protein